MPEISRFYGIVIQIYYGDHTPSHFHVTYSGAKAVIDIESLSLIEGTLPPRALGLVIEWATIHRDELRVAFNRAAMMEQPNKIDPLP